MAREIKNNNFEISPVVFMPNNTTNHAITFTNFKTYIIPYSILVQFCVAAFNRTSLISAPNVVLSRSV